MTKNELVSRLAEETGLTKTQSKRAIDTLFSTDDGLIVSAMREGDGVNLPGFGKFYGQAKAGRTGRNPATGEPVQIPEKTVPKFTPGAPLKAAFV